MNGIQVWNNTRVNKNMTEPSKGTQWRCFN